MKKIIATLQLAFWVPAVYAQVFKVSIDKSLNNAPYTGSIIVYLSKNEKTPTNPEDWIMINPVVSAKVKDLRPGESFTISSKNSQAFPVDLDNMERGDYYVQVVFDDHATGRTPASSPGNCYSEPRKITFTHDRSENFKLVANKKLDKKVFENTEYTKKISLPSILLSAFYKKAMTIDALVKLPVEYAQQPGTRFPLKISIGGFGADIDRSSGNNRPAYKTADSIPFVILTLDGNCATGHSVYANSANNGPWGDALVNELIPYIEKEYRTNGFRFVTGHSSGGWSSLWLQSHYPAAFHGCWSSSPDAIDFRNFEGVNLYTAKNVFYDSTGKLLPGMTVGGYSKINYKKDVCAWERIIRGEQYMSFNAIFGGRKPDGSIDYLWDFNSGKINQPVAGHWKKYDISHYLSANWKSLEKDLAGKILVSVGTADNWALEEAVYLLQKDAADKKMAINFSILPGDHFTVFTRERDSIGAAHTLECYEKWKNKNN